MDECWLATRLPMTRFRGLFIVAGAVGTKAHVPSSRGMDAILAAIFGIKDHVSAAQECARATLVFFYGLFILRFSGRRTFGKWSALDIVISVIAGSALSRAITGNAALGGTLAAVALLMVLHVVLAHGAARSDFLSRLVEGHPVLLSRQGKLDDMVRRRHMVSRADLSEALRSRNLDGLEQLDQTQSVTLEPNGKISILKKA
jgi:uncharacterized membrane protein YcaP (DUF421 family)